MSIKISLQQVQSKNVI